MVGLGALLLSGWLAAPALGRRLAYFDVRQVEVVGARHVPVKAIVTALRLPASASVFDPLGPVAARVRKVPGVASVEATRRLPGTLVLRVVETAPVALAMTAGGLQMMDGSGRVLPFDPVRVAPDLPLMERPDTMVAGFLGRLREIDPEFYAEVQGASRVRDDVVLRLPRHRVVLRASADADAVRGVRLVAADLARRGRSFAALDGRFADQVVVRWSES